MGTGPAGRDIFTVWVTTRRSGVLVWNNENPYVHLLQNWPLSTHVSLESFQKKAFSETRFLVGFSNSGFPAEELRCVDRGVGAIFRR